MRFTQSYSFASCVLFSLIYWFVCTSSSKIIHRLCLWAALTYRRICMLLFHVKLKVFTSNISTICMNLCLKTLAKNQGGSEIPTRTLSREKKITDKYDILIELSESFFHSKKFAAWPWKKLQISQAENQFVWKNSTTSHSCRNSEFGHDFKPKFCLRNRWHRYYLNILYI